MATIKLTTRAGTCPIHVGSDLSGVLRKELKRHAKDSRLFVIVDSGFLRKNQSRFKTMLEQSGSETLVMTVAAGEKSKSAGMVNRLHDWLLGKQVTRHDFVLAVGGGVVTDLAGYAAATVLRGVRWGAVPTTLLGMVDAAIGGKTGINHKSGKNLIGSFWQPAFVLCDVRFLSTLPKTEIISGLGEVVKYAGLLGGSEITTLANYLRSPDLISPRALTRIVRVSAGYKAKIVTSDERESGKRMWLNFGHTFGHGIEFATGFKRIPHGMAVTLGCLAAVALSRTLHPRDEKAFTPYERLLMQMIEQIPYVPFDIDKTLRAMQQDKKRSTRGLRFILLAKPGAPYIAEHVDMKAVRSALMQTLDRYRQVGGKRA